MKKLALLLACVAALTCVAGCGGSKLKTAFVEGVVKLDGSPVEGAIVTFSPVAGGTGVMATGVTDAQGRYLLTSEQGGGVDKGAVAGAYEVGIVKSENVAPKPTQAELEEASKNGVDISKEYPAEYQYIVPQKYMIPTQSGLTANVANGKNTFDFELTTE